MGKSTINGNVRYVKLPEGTQNDGLIENQTSWYVMVRGFADQLRCGKPMLFSGKQITCSTEWWCLSMVFPYQQGGIP